MLLSGMSTMVVTPPAAAARVAVAKPSHSVRPGSLTCTWVSTSPGISTSSSASRTVRTAGESRAERRDPHDDAAAHADLGGDELAVDEHPLAGDHEVVGSGCRGLVRLRHPLAHPHRLAARPVLGSVSRTWRFTSL